MEIKKTSKASLENKKSSWLLVGYVIVLVFMFVAFEWSKRDVRIDMSGAITENVFEQEIEIPITEQPELVAPPPPQAPAIAEVLTIVVNTSFDTPSDIGDYLMKTSGKWTLACLLL